jgi:predicted AlkP superfamily phosphohydrolase/phosphomutase
MNRRTFIKKTAALGLGMSLFPLSCAVHSPRVQRKKVIVLGIDGMDVRLSRAYMNQGLLPNFTRLAQRGGFRAVASSIPPQSPVAWSNVSVGASPAVHGIYDFIHRDPQTMMPYLSSARVSGPERTLNVGDWKIPLVGGGAELLRRGKPFWEYLAAYDIPATIFKMPANFPCRSKKVDMASGMGTPDLRGGYGSFTFFTTAPPADADRITGGLIIPVQFQGQTVDASLPGPHNTLREGEPAIKIPLKIWRDMHNSVVRLNVQGKEFLLKQGEWTGWVQVSFPMAQPFYDVKGICKFYIKNVHPEFEMYVSPINIDPSEPVLPVVSSDDYGRELVREVGYFYTQGLPEDTKALSYDVLTEDEYLDLAYQIIREREMLLDHELKRFSKRDQGMLFFYVSSLDQDTHMYWRTMDTSHPMYNEELGRKYGTVVKKLYMEMDKLLGKVMDQFDLQDPDFTLMVMSDHGFAPFRRQVNANSWLLQNGYLHVPDRSGLDEQGYFGNVDWSGSAAYALGINAVYVNLEGREKYGVVSPGRARQLLEDIRKGLLALVDPETGERVVSGAWIVSHSDRMLHPHAPDLIIGWNSGYRASWEGILGGFSSQVIRDNDDKWGGDHCIDPAHVPAVLFTNKRVTKPEPALYDITATILAEFGIPIPAHMEGQALYRI